MKKKMTPILEDVLAPGLTLVFCGTAAGKKSAQEQAYYAHRGNRFWPTLHEVGLTPHRFEPQQYRDLLTLRIGLTDVCKTASGNDDELPKGALKDVTALRANILRYQPRIVAFTSQTAAAAFLGKKKVALGLQAETVGQTQLFALTSTSGGNGHWKTQRHSWEALAALVKTLEG